MKDEYQVCLRGNITEILGGSVEDFCIVVVVIEPCVDVIINDTL